MSLVFFFTELNVILGRVNQNYTPSSPIPVIDSSGDRNYRSPVAEYNNDPIEMTDLESEISVPSTLQPSLHSYRSNSSSKFQGRGIFACCCRSKVFCG